MMAACSDAKRFSTTPSTLKVSGYGTAEMVLEYRPGTVDVEETGVVTGSSAAAGQVEYICSGQVGQSCWLRGYQRQELPSSQSTPRLLCPPH